jgi:type I restriction enzyme, S subunit
MTELPRGWSLATVEEVAADGGVTDGPFGSNLKTEHYTDSGPRVVRLQNIGDGVFRDEKAHISAEHFDQLMKHSVQPGDVLVASLGELLPRACVAPESLGPAIVKADCIRVRSGAAIVPSLLMWVLNAPQTRESVGDSIKGVGRPRINLRDLRALELPIPPLGEQERIVAAIEEAFSKLDAGEAGLRTVRQLIKRMRDAILAAAVTGRLVPQDPADTPATKLLADLGIESIEATDVAELPAGWVQTRVRDIALVGSGTTPKRGRPDYWEGGTVPWVTSGAVGAGVIREPSELVTDVALRETSLRLWPAGTLLVAMYGEGQTRGRCAELAIETTCNQACAAIALHPVVDGYRRLLRLHFDANYSANRRLAAGGVQPNLSGAIIKEMIVALPPVDEATRIVIEADRQFSVLDACERAVDAGTARAAATRQAVLKAAFEGLLVPQDPSDEPASVLLERIREERAAAPNATRRSRRSA